MGLFNSIVKALEAVGVLRKEDLELDPDGRLGINIDKDNVGLAKDATLNKLNGALESVDTDKLLMVIDKDNIGLAKDETLAKLTNALLSINSDKLVIDIGEDGVGLAKDATLQSVKNSLSQANLVTQKLSYSNTGTTTATYTVLASDLAIDFDGTITIQILSSIATTVQLKLTPAGSTTSYTGDLNGGSALVANAWYEFEFNVMSGDAINFEIPVPAGDTLSGLLRVFKRER